MPLLSEVVLKTRSPKLVVYVGVRCETTFKPSQLSLKGGVCVGSVKLAWRSRMLRFCKLK
ncbi:hypothetical protein D9611_014049 [Ephemerocybe angulata]|uniref:Uncharacterized protein n=1 Tax=Ephemerocybe angulata TaxID=980116 RepID=A0A8H5ARH4_9AGAR|nr:hypothetical protein D9611_014049 [Tulosesus angulatus]